METTDTDTLREYLKSSKTVAVLGASSDPERAGFYIPQRLSKVGYHIIPVNPNHAGVELWGEKVRGSLSEITEPVDILDVFRRPEALMNHLEEILKLKPRLVWLQSGIRNQAFADKLEAAGIPVVQDACLAVAHRVLLS